MFGIDELVDRLLHDVDPVNVIAIFTFISIVCRLIGKAIPETATGWRAWVRKITKVIGLYVSNRITPAQTQADMVQHAARLASTARQTASTALQVAERVEGETAPLVESREESGFVHAGLLWIVGTLGALLLLAGCAAEQLRLGADVICSNTETAQRLLDEARASGRKERFQQILNTLKTVCPFIQPTV